MTTLHTLDLAVVEIRNRFSKEMQFGTDGKRVVLQSIDAARQAVKVVMNCLDDIETAVVNTLDERQRAIATVLGVPGPQPATIEQEPEAIEQQQPEPESRRKPKLVGQAAGGEV